MSTDEKGAIALAAGADEYVLADGLAMPSARTSTSSSTRWVATGSPTRCAPFANMAACWSSVFTAGSIPTVAVNRLLLNNISVTGVGWGAYCRSRPGHIAGEWAAMEPHLRSGALKPVLGPTFPLDKAVDALQCLEARAATGKVVLTV